MELDPAKFESLSMSTIPDGYSTSQIAQLPASFFTALSTAQVADIDTDDFAALTTTQLQAITTSGWEVVSTASVFAQRKNGKRESASAKTESQF
jgi:hypothetical protein